MAHEKKRWRRDEAASGGAMMREGIGKRERANARGRSKCRQRSYGKAQEGDAPAGCTSKLAWGRGVDARDGSHFCRSRGTFSPGGRAGPGGAPSCRPAPPDGQSVRGLRFFSVSFSSFFFFLFIPLLYLLIILYMWS